MPENECEVYATEIIKGIRGEITQKELSRRLGFSFNKVAKWESGKEDIPWSAFCALCKICNFSIPQLLKNLFAYEGNHQDTKEIIRFLTKAHNREQISEATGASSRQVQRWLGGEREFDLCTFLVLVGLAPGALDFFLASVVSFPHSLKVKHRIDQYKIKSNLRVSFPIVSLIQRALSLGEFQEAREDVLQSLGACCDLTPPELDMLLRQLEGHGFIRLINGRYSLVEDGPLQLGLEEGEANKILSFWLSWIAKNYPRLQSSSEKGRGSKFGFNLFSCTDECFQEIQEHTIEYTRRVLASLQKDSGKKATRLGHVLYALSNLHEPDGEGHPEKRESR